MAGFRGRVVVASLCLLGMTAPAPAWWGWRGWSSSYAYNGPAYYVPTYYYAPSYPVCATITPTGPPLAAPQPAPPSKKAAERAPTGTGKEPPLMGDIQKKPPVVTESRSLSIGPARQDSTERCQVGFWNLSGRDVTLTVDGQQRLLPKDRAVMLDLARSFAWQVDQRAAVSERVPAERNFHEVILRQ